MYEDRSCSFIWDGENNWNTMNRASKADFRRRVKTEILDQYEIIYLSDLIDIYKERRQIHKCIYVME